MGANYLVELVAEWYEFQGYLVRRNVAAQASNKSGTTELDVIAVHTGHSEVVHVEASMDSDSWQKRDKRFRAKFRAGQVLFDELAAGMKKKPRFRQRALLVYARTLRRRTLGGGELVLLPQFLHEIVERLVELRIDKQIVPEHLPLIRTLQFVTEYREDLFARDWLF